MCMHASSQMDAQSTEACVHRHHPGSPRTTMMKRSCSKLRRGNACNRVNSVDVDYGYWSLIKTRPGCATTKSGEVLPSCLRLPKKEGCGAREERWTNGDERCRVAERDGRSKASYSFLGECTTTTIIRKIASKEKIRLAEQMRLITFQRSP